METCLAISPRNYHGADVPIEGFLWSGVGAVVLTVALVLASKAMEWFRNRKHPQREDEVWR
jgi:hypothetical protein